MNPLRSILDQGRPIVKHNAEVESHNCEELIKSSCPEEDRRNIFLLCGELFRELYCLKENATISQNGQN